MFAGAVNNQIQSLLVGSNYPAINSRDVADLSVPFPEYTEQVEIVSVLADMDAELAALDQTLDKARDIKQGMMQQLLTGKARLV